MRSALSLIALLAGSAVAVSQQPQREYFDSLRFSCFDHPFLSVDAHFPGHTAFPNVELHLTDSSGAKAGIGRYDRKIANSRYGKVAQVPNAPQRSKAVALEVCNAKPGRYTFAVWEHTTQRYTIPVTGDDGTNSDAGNETDTVNREPTGDSVCLFSFNFLMSAGKARIQWLDQEDRPLPFLQKPTCKGIPRA